MKTGNPTRNIPVTVGSRLAHYDVTALVGEGGMGRATLDGRYRGSRR